ncbi:uncharacterized protein LOC111700711 [Eurytemora carolleeae]|uniref:uncharacterized protein LOC111700711 n=1 Tax=Eurytemora carolleeae TaxID=1294199 RepID=UPI000C77D0C7|nr:uncharacterized protein LOC111700711 [Eurytemora carolleeae]|eukprot:XP_023327489.1 uncharacterized protein LOC111700711 [Eurytemora affinis]
MVRFVKPDWKCVFTYVQSFYRRFRDGRSPSPRPSTPSTTKLSEVAQAVAAEGDCQKKGEKDERNVTKKLAQAGPKFAEKDQAKPRPPPLMIKKSTSPSSITSSIQSPGTSTSSRIQSPGTPSWVRTTSPVSSGSPKWIKSSTEEFFRFLKI